MPNIRPFDSLPSEGRGTAWFCLADATRCAVEDAEKSNAEQVILCTIAGRVAYWTHMPTERWAKACEGPLILDGIAVVGRALAPVAGRVVMYDAFKPGQST